MIAQCDEARRGNAVCLFNQRKPMYEPVTTDPVLRRFYEALLEIYGSEIERVVLFGSRARGEARPGSDYDIAVFLKSLPDVWEERKRLANLRVDFIDNTGAFFEAKPYLVSAWKDQTPLMHEIRKDGVDL